MEEQCRIYKSEKLSPEGFCENAKITVEITDVMIQKQIEGINAIIIKVIYNDEIKEKKLSINDPSNNNLIVNEKFEFKPTSRRDRFEFIMIKLDENNNESEIGSKKFPLDEITSQEEYIVQITIPEIDDEDQVAAYINCKIILFWSDYEYYEEKKKKSEQKLRKLNEALSKTNYYLQKIKEVYGDLNRNYDSGYNNTYNLNNNNQNTDMNYSNNINNIGDKNNLNNNYNDMNNYSNNINYEDNQSPSTKYGLKGQKRGIEGIIDSSVDPQNVMRIDSESNYNTEIIPFKQKNQARLLGLCVILLGLIGSLKRPDFPNVLLGVFIVLSGYIGIKRGIINSSKWFKYILYADLLLILYDFIWLCTHYEYIWIDSYTGGKENFVGFLSVISCGVNILIKAFLAVLFLFQNNEIKKMLEEQNKNNYYN